MRGAGGTLLSLAGGGWPTNSPVEVDLATDSNGQLWYNGILSQATTSASGALHMPQFRLPVLDYCPYTTTPSSVTVLLIAHTPATGPFNGSPPDIRASQRIIFTYLSSPTFSSPTASNVLLNETLAGANVPLTSAGWEPGERVTITPLIAPWPNVPGWVRNLPIDTPSGANGAFTMTADAKGAFNIIYRLPDVAPASTVSLWIRANDARFGDIGFFAETSYAILPAIFPSVQLAQQTLIAGGTLTITGDHWPPNQQGIIEYCRGLTYDTAQTLYCNQYVTQTLGVFKTDAAGHFFAQMRLPVNARLGDITVQARIGDPNLRLDFNSRVYAQGQALTIVSAPVTFTYAEAHPRLTRLIAVAPYLGGSALALLVLLGALVCMAHPCAATT